MKDPIKIGVIGVGKRGKGLLNETLGMENVVVAAVCDEYADRRKEAADIVAARTGNPPFCTGDYREVLAIGDLDAVIVPSSWTDHIRILIDAMRAGKYAATEVGGAYTVNDCWELVRAYEETGIPCMMLENCCYGRYELMVLNMVKQGLFGEVVYCQGGYHHDLRREVTEGREKRHYRLLNYMYRNCENYPTHELGPIAKILDINRGNRMLTLTSMASRAGGLNEYIRAEKNDAHADLADFHFAQGDVVITTIRCARGETITLTLETTLPRAYSRDFQVHGTRALYMEDNNSVFIDGVHNRYDEHWHEQWNNAEKMAEKYDHPLWKGYEPDSGMGHGGMDFLVLSAFYDSVRRRVQTPIDVYDVASWMSVSALSEQSISLGGQPVAIPDFTGGRWFKREPAPEGPYCLDRICE